MVVINVSEVYYSYGEKDTLKNITFKAESGELVSIIGPNGSGKTTLLKLLYRSLKPTKGTITINGTKIQDIKKNKLTSLQSILPQDVSPLPMSVLELILIGRVGSSPIHKINKKELRITEESLEKLDAKHLLERNMLTLSGGEQKIAYIAMVLARNTDILLLDEPTAHLDYKFALKTMEAIKFETRENGKLVIMAMHDLTMALRYSTTLILLYQGKIMSRGPPNVVLDPKLLKKVYGVDFEVIRKGDIIEAVIPICR